MIQSRKKKRLDWLLGAVALVLNTTSAALLILKLSGLGSFSNDDLIAILLVIVSANIAIALVRKRNRNEIIK
jgi:hypothetical protein